MTDPQKTDLPENPNWDNFPCGGDPETQRLMETAIPCRHCRSTNISPASDLATPPSIVVICDECGTTQDDDAATLAEAVESWNGKAG